MTKPSLLNALDNYLSKVSVLKKGYPQEKYRAEQIKRSSLAKKPLSEITSVDVSEYRDARLGTESSTGKKLSAATVKLELSLLSNLFDIARIEWGWCDDNPVKNVRKPKLPPGRDRRLTPREDKLILRYAHNHSNKEWYSIVTLALETAMRQGEILSLKWENVNLKNGVVHLPETKNGTKRDVPLSFKAREALSRLGTKSSGRVFTYSQNGVKSTWRYMLEKLAIKDLHFHDMRHEACSRLFELGTLDVMEVAAISGHKSLSMLKRYTHLKAHRLVKKLDGGKSKSAHLISRYLVPYPASVMERNGGYEVALLDYPDVQSRGTSRDEALQYAAGHLLRKLVGLLQKGESIKPPDSFLAAVTDDQLVMIDPMD